MSLMPELKAHHKIGRSIDFLDKLRMTESKLIEPINRQVIINTQAQKQIKQITDNQGEEKQVS